VTDPAAHDDNEPIRVPVLYQLGWFRWLPSRAIDVEDLLHRFPGQPRRDVLGALRLLAARRGGYVPNPDEDIETLVASLPLAPAWETPEESDESADPSEPEGADLRAEREHYERRLAEYDELVSRLGLAPVRTDEQLLELMLRLGVLEERTEEDETGLWLADHAPLPTEVLPFTDEQRHEEDHVRWQSRYAQLSQRVLRLFVDDDTAELDRHVLATTLDRLAAATRADAEDVRQAVLVLVEEGDFTTARQGEFVDVERLRAHQRFDLVVHPDRFYQSRQLIHLNRPVIRPDA